VRMKRRRPSGEFFVRRYDCCLSDPARVDQGRLKYSDLSPHPGDDALEDQASVRGVLRGFGSDELPLVATQL
jgi:hypothetical protein